MDDREIFRKLANCQDKEQMARVIEEYNEQQKPKTNADRIRAMTDEELARFVATKIVNLESYKMVEQGHTPTATQLSALRDTMYCILMRWLHQPVEGNISNSPMGM